MLWSFFRARHTKQKDTEMNANEGLDALTAAFDRAERAIIGPVEYDADAHGWFFVAVAITEDRLIGSGIGTEIGHRHIERLRAALLRLLKAHAVTVEAYDDARRMAVDLAEQFPSQETAELLARHS
jgi:hypothetical protein